MNKMLIDVPVIKCLNSMLLPTLCPLFKIPTPNIFSLFPLVKCRLYLQQVNQLGHSYAEWVVVYNCRRMNDIPRKKIKMTTWIITISFGAFAYLLYGPPKIECQKTIKWIKENVIKRFFLQTTAFSCFHFVTLLVKSVIEYCQLVSHFFFAASSQSIFTLLMKWF